MMRVRFDSEARAVLIPSLAKTLGNWGMVYEDEQDLRNRANRLLDIIEGELIAADLRGLDEERREYAHKDGQAMPHM